jgi:hypothetical protein
MCTVSNRELALQHQASAQHQHPKLEPKPMSLCLLRALRVLHRPGVMTATEARHGLILLPKYCVKCSCSAHAAAAAIGPVHPHSRFPTRICRGSGVHPHHHPRFAGDRGPSPSPFPIGGSVPCGRLEPLELAGRLLAGLSTYAHAMARRGPGRLPEEL